MKGKILRSIFSIFMFAVIVAAGTTMAFFHDSDTPAPVYMTAGTIDFEILPPNISTSGSGQYQANEWVIGESKRFCWDIQNTGSKKFLLRVRPHDTPELPPQGGNESAWGKGEDFAGGNWSMYFRYTVGSGTETDPFITELVVGRKHKPVGFIKVWDVNENIYVKYEFNPGFSMSESHLLITDDYDEILKMSNPPPGKFPFKDEHGRVDEYTYIKPLSGTTYSWEAGEELYIATHAEGVPDPDKIQPPSGNYNLSWSAAPGCPLEKSTGDTWWYYTGAPVQPGESVTICLEASLPDGVPADTNYTIYLEVEAFQATNNAPTPGY